MIVGTIINYHQLSWPFDPGFKLPNINREFKLLPGHREDNVDQKTEFIFYLQISGYS